MVRFSNNLKLGELERFRGAVIESIDDKDVLFHNHISDNYRYSYPLIQYKCLNGKASILCIEEGTEVVGKLLSKLNEELRIGDRYEKLEIERINANQHLVQIWKHEFHYCIKRWLPLNQLNYDEYIKLSNDKSKDTFLEKILTANILSFAKGVNLFFDKRIETNLKARREVGIIPYKGVKIMAFDVYFITNVSLPQYIGLGKGVSINYGTLSKYYKPKLELNGTDT